MNDQLSTLGEGAQIFVRPFVEAFYEIAQFLPNLLVAFILLILGLIVSPLIGRAVSQGLDMIHTDELMDKFGVRKALSSVGLNVSFASGVGTVVKYIVLVIFLTMVADALQLEPLSDLINSIIRFIPDLVIALVILMVGLTAADFVRDVVVNMARASDNSDYAGILGSGTRIGIIVFAVMAALSQVGIAPVLIQIIFAGVVFALALAFGLGAKEHVSSMMNSLMHHTEAGKRIHDAKKSDNR